MLEFSCSLVCSVTNHLEHQPLRILARLKTGHQQGRLVKHSLKITSMSSANVFHICPHKITSPKHKFRCQPPACALSLQAAGQLTHALTSQAAWLPTACSSLRLLWCTYYLLPWQQLGKGGNDIDNNARNSGERGKCQSYCNGSKPGKFMDTSLQ